MKQIMFALLFASLFVACDNNSDVSHDTTDNHEVLPDSTQEHEMASYLTQISIKERPCETLEYIGKIGSNFDTALDSLRKLKSFPSEIRKEPLEVIFDYDDRLFFGIIYGFCGNYSDVLDTKGYYYLRTWYCPEENN